MIQRERLDYDAVIVGAGPAGLAAAIRLKQCKPELSVCVLEKGSEVGAFRLVHCAGGSARRPRRLASRYSPDSRAQDRCLRTGKSSACALATWVVNAMANPGQISHRASTSTLASRFLPRAAVAR
ncbi:MAG: FAD-binding protein [Xanthomonadaceae bacterium]|nr:FAD-binding protein [Xanthomonadaceae bacterium]